MMSESGSVTFVVSIIIDLIFIERQHSKTTLLISFCHTNLAHSNPDVFELETVQRAFTGNPEVILKLVKLFKSRFDPSIKNREKLYTRTLREARLAIDRYNTGHRHHDGLRKTIFKAGLSFITNTLKTNFFIHLACNAPVGRHIDKDTAPFFQCALNFIF